MQGQFLHSPDPATRRLLWKLHSTPVQSAANLDVRQRRGKFFPLPGMDIGDGPATNPIYCDARRWAVSVIDQRGVQVRRDYNHKPDIEKSKDMLVIGLHSQGLPWRMIGRILRVNHAVAYRRYHAIPEHVRAHYAQSIR